MARHDRSRAEHGDASQAGEHEATEHTIELRPIAWRCPAGARLRLDVSGARFPAFDRNPQSDVAPAHARAEDTVVATITVHRVRLDLPIDLGPGGSI